MLFSQADLLFLFLSNLAQIYLDALFYVIVMIYDKKSILLPGGRMLSGPMEVASVYKF